MRRISIILALVLCCAWVAQAQDNERAALNALVVSTERASAAHPDSVPYYAQRGLPLALKLNDIAAETRIQTCVVIHTFLQGHFDSAVSIGSRMVSKGERYPPYPELATLYYELSGVYSKNGYHDISGRLIQKGLAVSHVVNNDRVLADGYSRLGVFYEKENKLDSALQYYESSLALNDKIGELLGKSYALENIAGIYTRKKNFVKALYFLKQSLAYKQMLGNKTALAIVYMNIAEAFADLKQYDSSIYYVHKTQEIAYEIQYKDIIQYSYKFLSDVYERQGDNKTALAYHKRFAELNDSIFTETQTRQMAEVNTRYETEKKEQQIEKLNQQTVIQSLQIKQRNTLLAAGAALLVILIVIAWTVYNRRKLKEEAKLQVEINKQQAITAREVIHAEERERRRIAADLHDGVGQLLSAALMNLNGLMNKTPMTPESEQLAGHTVALVTESYDELRQISHQMIPNTLLKAGLASAVKDMVMRLDQSKLAVSLEASGLNERLNEEVETVLYRVIQESVNNVIKHAKATKLNIQLNRDEEGIAVTIEDNGAGFDTRELKDKGIGLKNMRSRVAFHKGSAEIDSSPQKGTLVAVFIPL